MNIALLCLFMAARPLIRPAYCSEPQGAAIPASTGAPAERVPEGYRGISLEFDSDRVYYVSPEDHVDIMAYSGKHRATVRFLQNVRVTAIEPFSANEGKSLVQFAVTPQEAQYLAMSTHSGDVWLALRKKGDMEMPSGMVVSLDTIVAYIEGTVRKTQSYQASPDEGQDMGPLAINADRPTILAAVQGRMRGRTYLALSLPIASDKVAFVKPGDRIDILATLDLKRPEHKPRKTTLTLLQYITVLDVRRSGTKPGRSVLLLELDLPRAQTAIVAWNTADIQLITRNKNDRDVHPIAPEYIENAIWGSRGKHFIGVFP